jgi:hypothetical protein
VAQTSAFELRSFWNLKSGIWIAAASRTALAAFLECEISNFELRPPAHTALVAFLKFEILNLDCSRSPALRL